MHCASQSCQNCCEVCLFAVCCFVEAGSPMAWAAADYSVDSFQGLRLYRAPLSASQFAPDPLNEVYSTHYLS